MSEKKIAVFTELCKRRYLTAGPLPVNLVRSIAVESSYSPTSAPFGAGLLDVDDLTISNIYNIGFVARIFYRAAGAK